MFWKTMDKMENVNDAIQGGLDKIMGSLWWAAYTVTDKICSIKGHKPMPTTGWPNYFYCDRCQSPLVMPDE